MVYECSICEESLEDQPPIYHVEGDESDSDSSEIEANSGAADENNSAAPFIMMTTCRHMFHETCLTAWCKDKSLPTCPVCRVICPAYSLARVFPTSSESTSKGPKRCEKCDNAEEELELARGVALSYEELIKENQDRISALESEKAALIEALKDAFKQLLEAIPDPEPIAAQASDTDQTLEVSVATATEHEQSTIIQSPSSSSVMQKNGGLIGEIPTPWRDRVKRQRAQSSRSTGEVTGGASGAGEPRAQRRRLNDQTGEFEDDFDEILTELVNGGGPDGILH